MNGTILLAIDSADAATPSVAMVRDLARATGDPVVVLHVHEIAVGRWGRARVDCVEGDGGGDAAVDSIVAELRQAGVDASPKITETGLHGVAHGILAVADEIDARAVVVCTRGRGDIGSLTLGSVAHRLIHQSTRPVLVVPQHPVVDIRAQQSRASSKEETQSMTAW